MTSHRALRTALAVLVLAACSGGGGESEAESTPPISATGEQSSTPTNSVAPSTTAEVTTTTAPPETYPQSIDELLTLGRPIVLAHTGGEDEFPGGTLFGFSESVNAGVDMLDMNVLLTADGVLIVQHDLTVDRTTNGAGALADLSFAEVSALDNAFWFTPECGVCADQPEGDYVYRGIRTGEKPAPAGYTADDFAIPSFREMVTRFPDLPLNIEIKGEGEPAIAAARVLADELVELGRASASVVTSFDDSVVEVFHQLLPDVEVSPGLNATTEWVLARTPLPAGMRILQLPPEFGDVVVITPELIADSTAAGYPIWVWPNNRDLENYASYVSFIQMGIVGLNINFPQQGVRAVLDVLG